MSVSEKGGHDSPGAEGGQPIAPPAPLKPPKVDMTASSEVQAWIARLQAEQRTVGRRNRWLAVLLAGGILGLLGVLWGVYRATVGAYAVLEDVRIEQHPASQGRAEISFRVAKPGKVHYRRTSGNIETNLIDYFYRAGQVRRSWAWSYRPGENIEVTLWYRRGPLRRAERARFATAGRADIVILVDTTGSMSRSIAELKERCVGFSAQLAKQALRHRIALIGFGDAREGRWLDKHDFTTDIEEFRSSVAGIERFDGGDLPESALDALEEALSLALEEEAIRRFYLVTDAPYHEPTRSGATAADVADRLERGRVVLYVFSRPEFEGDYRRLLSAPGRFQEIENFGPVFSEGRVLED